MFRPKKVSRKFKGYKKDKKVAFLLAVIVKMSADIKFKSPPIAYADATTQIKVVTDAITRSTTKIPGAADDVEAAFKIVDVTFESLAGFVDTLAKGDENIIFDAGFLSTSGEASSVEISDAPVLAHVYIAAAGEAAFTLDCDGEDVTFNFIISTDLSGLKKVGHFYTNPTVGAQTFFGSSTHKKITVTGLPSKTDLFIVCYATNNAGDSILSVVLPFSCK